MRRRIAIAAVLLAGLVAPLAATAPASADSGVGCTGAECSINLKSLIHLHGNYGESGTSSVPVDVPPPPCLWEPIGDQTSGSQAIIDEWGNDPSKAPTNFDVDKSVAKANDLLKNPTPGTWYMLPVNPNATAAGKAECLKLPLYAFAVQGDAPPAVPIPPRTLAAYAYNHMIIQDPTVTVSPAANGYVNLGSYVWAVTNGGFAPGVFRVTADLGNGDPGVTVWAHASRHISVTANGPGTASTTCGPKGSKARPIGTAPPGAVAGQAPDCGVLWNGPDAHASVSVTVTWHVTWGVGQLNGPGNHNLPDITTTGTSGPLTVREIQSINNGDSG